MASLGESILVSMSGVDRTVSKLCSEHLFVPTKVTTVSDKLKSRWKKEIDVGSWANGYRGNLYRQLIRGKATYLLL